MTYCNSDLQACQSSRYNSCSLYLTVLPKSSQTSQNSHMFRAICERSCTGFQSRAWLSSWFSSWDELRWCGSRIHHRALHSCLQPSSLIIVALKRPMRTDGPALRYNNVGALCFSVHSAILLKQSFFRNTYCSSTDSSENIFKLSQVTPS